MRSVVYADVIEPSVARLWGPGGKQLAVGKLLSDYVGRNDKTKALLRLQRESEGAPGREPTVSAAEQAAMLAFYRKKQDEAARLAVRFCSRFVSVSCCTSRAHAQTRHRRRTMLRQTTRRGRIRKR